MPCSRKFHRAWRGTFTLSCLFGLSAELALAARKDPPRGDDYGSVVALSPYEVTAQSMEFGDWQKYVSPHFLLYTDAGAKESKLIVRHLEMMHQATQFFLKRRAPNLPPFILVLPTSGSDWRKIGSKGRVEWKAAASLVGSTRPVLLIEHDWQSEGLYSVWAMLAMHEADAMNLHGPLWFQRGIADFFRTVKFDGDTLTLGTQGTDAFWINKYGWMDWKKFFSITSRSPEFTKDSNDHHRYEGQCGVFTHYLLTRSDPAAVGRLLGWAAYLDAGNPPTEDSFKALFGQDWKSWENQLHQMLDGGSYTTGKIKFPPAALQFSITVSPPPAREMRELFVLSRIMNQNIKDSDRSLDAVLARGLKAEGLRELLADACKERHRHREQLEQLRPLIAAGSTNPAVYADAAGVLFDEAAPDITPDTRIGASAGEIRAWCEAARKLEPLNLKASEIQAWTEALATGIDARSAERIANICRTLDGSARTDRALAALAIARWRLGDAKRARSLAERLDGSVLSGAPARKIARAVLTRLDSPTAPVPAAAPSPAPSAATP